MSIDLIVLVAYFAFLIAIGWMFRNMTNSTSDYFRGGGKMLWWMVGATAFMTQFSAWTFTGASGKAYTDGFQVVFIFLANAFGYLMNYLYFAPKFRQLRVTTVIQAIRQRFGNTNEQVFTWASMPNSVVNAGIWLNGLAIIASTMFGFDMTATIIITGLVVLFMSVTGGAWAVIASDFMQMLVIMAVTVTVAVVALIHGGGPVNIIEQFPRDFVMGQDMNYISLFALWGFFIFMKQFAITNNMLNSYRYLSAKDSENAKKAALLACILMVIGPLIWFFPSWFMASQDIDLMAMHPEMGAKALDTTYLTFVQVYMPAGMVGLLVAAMFAATMSSMDSGLNKNSGIFVKNFYEPVLRKNQAKETELVLVSKISSTVFGILIILTALFIQSLKGLSLFDTMMYVGALLSFPMLIPAFMGFFIKKTPDWAGWATLVVGAGVSYVVGFVIKPEHIEAWFNLAQPLTRREWSDLVVVLGLGAHAVFTGGFFALTCFFYKPLSEERQVQVDKFFRNLDTPLINESAEQQELDNKQRMMLGRLISVAGLGIMAMMAIPNPLWGRAVFALCGGLVMIIGLLLVYSAQPNIVSEPEADAEAKA